MFIHRLEICYKNRENIRCVILRLKTSIATLYFLREKQTVLISFITFFEWAKHAWNLTTCLVHPCKNISNLEDESPGSFLHCIVTTMFTNWLKCVRSSGSKAVRWHFVNRNTTKRQKWSNWMFSFYEARTYAKARQP